MTKLFNSLITVYIWGSQRDNSSSIKWILCLPQGSVFVSLATERVHSHYLQAIGYIQLIHCFYRCGRTMDTQRGGHFQISRQEPACL